MQHPLLWTMVEDKVSDFFVVLLLPFGAAMIQGRKMLLFFFVCTIRDLDFLPSLVRN